MTSSAYSGTPHNEGVFDHVGRRRDRLALTGEREHRIGIAVLREAVEQQRADLALELAH